MWPIERRVRRALIRVIYRMAFGAAFGAVVFASTATAQSSDGTVGTQKKDDVALNLRKLGFLGVHSVRVSSGRPERDALHSFGEFTIDGPLLETLRPMLVNDAGVVETPDGEVFFYGPYNAGRIGEETGARTRLEDESIGRQPYSGKATAMTYDTRRNRLLLSLDKYLYAYDIQAKRWLWRKDIKMALLGLAYDAGRDMYYGVIGEKLDPRDVFLRERMAPQEAAEGQAAVQNAPLKVRHFTPEGESYVEVTVQKPLPPKPIAYNFQTAFSQNLLVLFTDHSLFAINPMTGQVVYRGETTLVRDGKPWQSDAPISLSNGERYEQLKQRFAAVRERLDKTQTAVLDARLGYLGRCIAGQFSTERVARQPEIHAVGLYTVDRADKDGEAICTVTVTHAAAPLILILSGYESTTWRLKIDPKVEIEQIVLAGHNNHSVEGAQAGTAIIQRNYLEQPQHALNVAPDESRNRPRAGLTGMVHAQLGSAPMSFQYESNASSFEIGAGNTKWRESYLDALLQDLKRELLLAENQDLQFTALVRHGQSEREQSALVSFSLSSPKKAAADWLSKNAVLIAGQKGDNQFIVDRTNEIYALRKGELTPLASPEKDVPGRTTAILFDAPRDRLLAWHSHENRQKNGLSQLGRVLIAYDVVKHAWEQIGSPGVDIGAVALDENKDVFYGLALPHFSNAVRDLVVMNHYGAVLASVPLSQPFYWDLDAGPPQAVFARGHLIVVNSPQSVLLPDGKERLVAQVIAIDPTNGQTFFTGRYFCD